ncbi:MAG: hypothetical protein NZM03_10495, partial [Limisphaera sp.]|nr:hypothetical protein [Limisphaera sp.]
LGTNAVPVLTNNLFWRCTQGNGGLGTIPTASLADNPEANPLLRGISRMNDARLLPLPVGLSSPVYAGYTVPPNDGFYTAASYKGAFDQSNWLLRWTALDNNGFLGWQLPPPALRTTPSCPAPTLVIVRNGSGVILSWLSHQGCTYQLQTKSPLTSDWQNWGAPISGDGTVKSLVVPMQDAERYFRLLLP